MIVASWPTLGGRLAGARFLSLGDQAPLLGETAILYFLTEQPAPGVQVRNGGTLPGFVYVGAGVYFVLGLLFVAAGVSSWRRWQRRAATGTVRAPIAQAAVWLLLIAVALATACLGNTSMAMIAALFALFLRRIAALTNTPH